MTYDELVTICVSLSSYLEGIEMAKESALTERARTMYESLCDDLHNVLCNIEAKINRAQEYNIHGDMLVLEPVSAMNWNK